MLPEANLHFNWEKLGRIFNPDNVMTPGWVQQYAQAPNTININGKTLVFFCSRLNPDSAGKFVSRAGYFELKLKDGIEIGEITEKPIIPLGSLGSFDEFGTYPFSPVVVGEEVFAAYGGWTRCDSTPFDVSIGLAKADVNHLKFSKYKNGPILSKSLHEPFVISSPKLRFYDGTFYLFYIAGNKWVNNNQKLDPIYTIRMATSKDCLNWEKNDKQIISNKLGNDEAQASPDVFYHSGYFHMFFCYRHGVDFRNSERGYRMGYAYSTDLVNWVRDDTRSDLTPSKAGWDSESVSYPHVFTFENHIYMAYLGNEIGKTGIGLARLKDDAN
jgi:hypothetical protein